MLRQRLALKLMPLLLVLLLAGCNETTWNNPYPASDSGKNILYDNFTAPPKTLDPAKSYNSNEYLYLAQLYEPPYQYHFLKRPYQLIPATAAAMPRVERVMLTDAR